MALSRYTFVAIVVVAIVITSVTGYYIGSIGKGTLTQTTTITLPSTVTSAIISTAYASKTFTEVLIITQSTTAYKTLTSVVTQPTEIEKPVTLSTTVTKTTTVTTTATAPQPPKSASLFTFYLPWDDSLETVTSLSSYLDKPAGKYGHTTIGPDGHLYAGEKRIRFLGVSVVGPGAFPSKEEADAIAARLAKFGINLVRFHALDANWEPNNNIFQPPGTRNLRQDALDRLDYFVAALKRNGIYININLMCYRQFSSADGLPSEVNNMAVKDQHTLPFFYEPAKQLAKEFAMKLFTHVNPYTGLSYAEDPAVAFVEILNEYGITFGWLDGAIDRLPKVFRDALRERWNDFLIAKYGSTENLRKAWGDTLKPGENLEEKTVDVFNYADVITVRPSQQARMDWAEFLWYLDYNYFTEMYSYLKNELGVKALIIGTQSAWGGTPNILANLDAIDAHHYWRYPVGSGNNWYVLNDAMVNNPRSNTISQLALRSVLGKPFTISEYNHPAPNMYRPEGFVLLAAYAAFQDWDAIMPYSYGPYTSGHIALASWNSTRMRGTLDFDQDPARMALMLTAHMLFVRGDVSPAKQVVGVKMTKGDEIRLVATLRAGAWNMPSGTLLDVPYYVPLVHRAAVVVDNITTPISYISPSEVPPPEGGIIKSDTEELIWDCSDVDRCVFIVNTLRSIVLTGFLGDRRFTFGNITIEVKDTLLGGWATIAMHVVEGSSFADAKRILVLTIGVSLNSNMPIYKFDTKQKLFTTSVNLTKDLLSSLYGVKISNFGNWGSGPTIVEGINATITISTKRSVSTWILNNVGRKLRPITVLTQGGSKVVELRGVYSTIWYELQLY